MTEEEINKLELAMELSALGPSCFTHPSIMRGMKHMLGIDDRPAHERFKEIGHE